MTTQEKIDALKILVQLLESPSTRINRLNVANAINSIVLNLDNGEYKAKLDIEGINSRGEQVKIKLGE